MDQAFAVLQPTASASSSSSSSRRPAAGREAAEEEEEREHMFDKVVTPSDVGKLNRLVIPKQCAERFFPLDPAASADNKGLLLGFEDAGGRQWSFRYSYWHSSQSYVMTKGWSRFVKEKQLRAGDTVSFSRTAAAAADDDQCAPRRRFFIDLRTRSHRYPLLIPFSAAGDSQRPQTALSLGGPSIARPTRQSVFLRQYHGVVQELTEGRAVLGGGGYGDRNNMGLDSLPLVTGGGAAKAKRVRLFGVNLECPAKE